MGNEAEKALLQKVAHGRALARARIQELVPVASQATEQLGRRPTLAIVAGSDPASRRFVQIKQDALASLNLAIETVWLDTATTTDDALAVVRRLNADAGVDGIFLQFPLPAAIDAQAAANAMALAKDIDCSSKDGMRRLVDGASPYEPAAPAAARDLLRAEFQELKGREVIILGNEDVFAIGLEVLLKAEGAACSISSRLDAAEPADAVVVSEASPTSMIPRPVTSTAVLLDAGYYLPPRPPGWLSEESAQKFEVHITQYGNVGPLTVAYLAAGTLAAARSR